MPFSRLILFCLFLAFGSLPAQICLPVDRTLIDSQLNRLPAWNKHRQPIGPYAAELGKRFLGTPYEAATLEQADRREELVLRLAGLDCLTFVENVVAMARLGRQDVCSFREFADEIERLRYRKGVRSGYPSRLHYFSDWLYDNAQKGVLRIVTPELGGVAYDKQIDFMGTHRSAYPSLSDDSAYAAILRTEARLNQRTLTYLPKSEVEAKEALIEPGDLLGITTSIEGLDLSHTGIAVRQNGRIHLLHASTRNNEVEISLKPLADYLKGNKKQTGIMVARLLEPEGALDNL